MNDIGAYKLCAAIVEQAVKDLKKEIKEYKKTQEYSREFKKLVKFFKSQWCSDLLFGSVTGEEIMEAVISRVL